MARHVTSHGKVIDREMYYEVTCKSCGTSFTYQYEDVTVYSPNEDGICTSGVSCPNGDCRVIRPAYKSDFLREREKSFFQRLFE